MFGLFLINYLLQVFDAHPLEGRLFVLKPYLLNYPYRFEDIDDIVEPADLGLDKCGVISENEEFCGLFE